MFILQHWKAIFEKYDLDGDGKISLQELKAMIRGPDFSKDIPAGVVRTIMRKADLDDSGYLEYPEFIAMVSVFRFFTKILEMIFVPSAFRQCNIHFWIPNSSY